MLRGCCDAPMWLSLLSSAGVLAHLSPAHQGQSTEWLCPCIEHSCQTKQAIRPKATRSASPASDTWGCYRPLLQEPIVPRYRASCRCSSSSVPVPRPHPYGVVADTIGCAGKEEGDLVEECQAAPQDRIERPRAGWATRTQRQVLPAS
jgi:hypothetical protein